MEIDPTSALEEFKQTLSGALETFQENKEGSNSMASGMLGSLGLGDIGKDLKGFVGSITDPPPGTDEIVALSKVSFIIIIIFPPPFPTHSHSGHFCDFNYLCCCCCCCFVIILFTYNFSFPPILQKGYKLLRRWIHGTNRKSNFRSHSLRHSPNRSHSSHVIDAWFSHRIHRESQIRSKQNQRNIRRIFATYIKRSKQTFQIWEKYGGLRCYDSLTKRHRICHSDHTNRSSSCWNQGQIYYQSIYNVICYIMCVCTIQFHFN